jgi:cysteinyl-tRNA synthetase
MFNMIPQTPTLFDSYSKVPVSASSESGKTLKIYSCGPTVYSYQHIGNMRAAWLASSYVDFTKTQNINTEWVLNITDVGHLVGDGDDGQNTDNGEDKLEKGAKKEDKNVKEIVDFYKKDYESQCGSLKISLPKDKYYPKATEYIKEQMLLSLTLLKNKKAYLLDDGIYFDSEANNELILPFDTVKGDSNFTGRNIENITKNPADFALWKFVDKDSLQKWRFEDFDGAVEIIERFYDFNLPYPNLATKNGLKPKFNPKTNETKTIKELKKKWGCPGWHSECVAMICKILNGSFPPILDTNESVIDIHFGGEDHIDIHHKNEILQSEALGFHLSKAWVHNKFVTVDSKKMSKSVGNVYTVIGNKEETGFDSIEQKGFDPLAYRLLLQEHHYTTQLDFTWDKLQQSQNRLYNLRKETAKITSFWNSMSIEPKADIAKTSKQDEILSSPLCDNFNVPRFLEKYEELVKETSNAIKTTEVVNANNYSTLKNWEKVFLKLDLFPIAPKKVLALARKRNEAKSDRDFEKSDEIRDSILELGYQIDDYTWGFGLWKKRK